MGNLSSILYRRRRPTEARHTNTNLNQLMQSSEEPPANCMRDHSTHTKSPSTKNEGGSTLLPPPVAKNVTHNSIQLEWTKPEQDAHNIISYTIFYRSTNDPPDQWIQHNVHTHSTVEKLTVLELSESTSYCFKIRTKCEVGVGLESDISVPIQTKMIIPSKPGKPKVSTVTHDSVHLKWKNPEQGAHNISSYTVFYRCTGDLPGVWSEHRAVINKEMLLLPRLVLSENKIYNFKVRPECEAGIGLESDISDPIQTKMIIPSKPGKPIATTVTHNSIQLDWTIPEQGAHNITSYTVFYHSAGDPPDTWSEHKAVTNEKVLLPQLSENMIYYFKIRPECEAGVGLESDISDPIQTKTVIPSKPGKPIATTVTHNSIQLDWTKPEQGAHNITSYTVFYHSAGDPPDTWSEHKAVTNEKVLLPQLSENMIYYFKIRPECEAGVGLESDISDPIQTKTVIPSKPGKPIATIVTHNSIQLDWTKPEQGAHNITSYTVFYHSTGDPPDTWSEHKAVTNEKVLLPQLSENMIYYFKIRPECEAGVGLESDISDPIQTKMVIPSKPGKPIATIVTHNSIQLDWTKPEQGAHNITSYVIFYHSVTDPPDQWIQLKTGISEEKFTVSHLSESTSYSFKVQPEHEGGVGTESDVSDSVKTDGLPLRIVVNKLWDAKGKWYYIGLCLGLNKTDLDTIERDNQHSTDSCFRKMISKWLELVSGTWQMLIDALRDKTVGFHDLADSIEVEFLSNTSTPTCGGIIRSGGGFKCPLCGTCSLEKYLKGECPKFQYSSDSAFPFLDTNKLTKDEKLILQVKLIKETRNINDEFKDLVYQLSESFEEMPSKELQKVANFVKFRLSIYMPPLEINSASAIMEYLNKNISCFNYDNVKLIIDKFGTDKDKESLRAYEIRFKNFCERSVFEVPEAVFGSPPDHGHEMLAFKVTDQIIKSSPPTGDHGLSVDHPAIIKSAKTLQMSLHNTLYIQSKIAELLGIENVGCLVFLGASKGCIELKFSAPNAVLDKLKEQHNVETLTELPGFVNLKAANIYIMCGPPGKPHAVDVTSNTVNLQWSKPEYQGSHLIQHYCVHYKSLKDPLAKWRTVQSKAFVENMEIGRLSQNETPFVFKVQAVNEIGAGVSSKESDLIDLMRPPLFEISGDFPSKPSKPIALTITHESIQLEWTKPERGVESITSYTILYHAQFHDPPNQWTEKRSVSTEERMVVSPLLENTTYLFVIRPECEAGVGSESDVSDPITTKMITPSKPGKPEVSNITHDSIQLKWSKPEQGSHNITSYNVFYRPISGPSDQWSEYKTEYAEERATVSMLLETTAYCFKIQAVCVGGCTIESDISEPIMTLTSESDESEYMLRFYRMSA